MPFPQGHFPLSVRRIKKFPRHDFAPRNLPRSSSSRNLPSLTIASESTNTLKRKDDFSFEFNIKEFPLPALKSDELLVSLSATGVCGTDLGLASGKLGPARDILGHEGVGRIVALGSTTSNFKLGQRVGVGWLRDICGECPMCKVANEEGETRCFAQLNSGRKIDGTFAEYTVIPSRYVLELPEGLKDEEIAPILCGGVTVYKALKICGAERGNWVAITGAGGGVGALGIQYAVAMGYKVAAIDGGAEKGGYCTSLGASAYVDFTTAKDIASTVKESTCSIGINAAIAVAGSGAAYRACFGMMAPFGTIVCVGIPPPSDLVSFHPLEIIDLGVRVIGSAVGTRMDVLEALAFVARGEVKPAVKIARLEQLNEIVDDLRKETVCGPLKLSNDES